MYRKLREMWRAADGAQYCGRQGIDYEQTSTPILGTLGFKRKNMVRKIDV